jgi:hypothetical protein
MSVVSTTERSGAAPLRDITAEARRVLDVADTNGVALRLLGGLAVALRVPPGATQLLPREYRDIDFIVPKGTTARRITALVAGAGYTEDEQFNAVNGHRRLLFHDEVNRRQMDVFLGTFAMCHEIPIGDRVDKERDTIPLAELLLTKLQVVEINDKDLHDVFTLLYHADLGETDGAETINVRQVATLCAADWGLWRTASLNIERAAATLPALELGISAREVLSRRLTDLRARIDAEPKTRKWKLRARIGDRVQWYEDVEEVG